MLKTFKEQHPGCNFSYSPYSDQYSKLVIESFGCSYDNVKVDKIIKNIVKEMVIDKSSLLCK